MATLSDSRRSNIPTVIYDEPPIKPPPALVVGPLAWVRKNLFSSWLNAFLTVVSVGLTAAVVGSLINWVVTQANWFVVIYNIRQFTLGRYDADAEWRIILMSLFIAFVVGVSLAAWARVPRIFGILTVIVLALIFILPPIINSTISLPPTFTVVGNTDITSGAANETPIPHWGFIARAGEVVRLRFATDLSTDDEHLQSLHSFGDNAANLLRAAASNRLTNQARAAEINALEAADTPNNRTLTDKQRAALDTELNRLQVPDSITDTYALNQTSVQWQIVRGSTMETVAEGTLDPDSAAVEVTLPEDGWYILNKTAEGTAMLETTGIYPLLQRDFTRSEVRDESGTIIQQAGRYSEYVRMTDGWTTGEIRPEVEGKDVPMAIIIDTQYRGDRTPSDWLRLYVSQFLTLTNAGILWLTLAVVVGYFVAQLADRYLPARQKVRNPRFISQRASMWMLTALPLVMFVLAYGVGNILPITNTRNWGGLFLTVMLTMVGIIGSFPLGILLALGRRSKLPVVSAACTLYIEFVRGVPLIAVLFMAQLLLPLVNPALQEVDNVFRAMVGILLFSAAYLAENVRGGLQAIPPGQEEAAKALGFGGWQITVLVTLPQALRFVIPALVGQFISLFKDTTLVAIVGLIDLLGMAQATVAQTEFLGTRREVFLFIALIYFVFSYVMAAISRRLEASGSGAARRV